MTGREYRLWHLCPYCQKPFHREKRDAYRAHVANHLYWQRWSHENPSPPRGRWDPHEERYVSEEELW